MFVHQCLCFNLSLFLLFFKDLLGVVEKLSELARQSDVHNRHVDDDDEDDQSDLEESFAERNVFSTDRSLPDLISNRTHLDQTSSNEVILPSSL